MKSPPGYIFLHLKIVNGDIFAKAINGIVK